MQHPGFAYMTWAKGHYWGTRLSLIPSGMLPPPPELLGLRAGGLARIGPDDIDLLAEIVTEGPGTLQEQFAHAYGTDLDHVLVTQGSTQADLLAFTSFVQAGDRVLIEDPAYGLFESLALTRGARVDRFRRRFDDGWRLDFDALLAAWQPETRLVVLTSVHNPTGQLASEDELVQLGELCAERGALALCSEVYLDFVAGAGEPGGRRFAFQLHPRLLTANSLTKVYGLGSLRMGALFAHPQWIAAARPVRETIAPVLPALPSHLASAALHNKDALLARARECAEAGRASFAQWLSKADGFSAVLPEAGLVTALRVHGVTDTVGFATFVRERFELGVVPGDFFGLPGFLRIGWSRDMAHVSEALATLAAGRNAWLGAHA